jgi:hypothetical protein
VCVDEWLGMCGWMGVWMDGSVDGWECGWMGVWMDGSVWENDLEQLRGCGYG